MKREDQMEDDSFDTARKAFFGMRDTPSKMSGLPDEFLKAESGSAKKQDTQRDLGVTSTPVAQ